MIGVTWTGWDGSVWDLHNGPVYLGPNFEGFAMLTADEFVRETALTDGQYFTGWRAKPRPVLFPVLFEKKKTEGEWLALDRAWWRTMRFDRPGVLTVTAPDGGVRRLTLRFENDGGWSSRRDPSQDRTAIAAIQMKADDPWWVGDTFTQTFDNGGNQVNFFGGLANKATPYRIGKSSTIDTATMTNPGDIPVWPIYRIDGLASAFRSVLDGRAVAGNIPVAEGQHLEIDTSPQRQVAYLFDGATRTNVTRQLTEFNFARLPDGVATKLDIQLSGPGALIVSADPKYYKAW